MQDADTGDPVEVLRRWERSGAVWRVLGRTSSEVTVGLYTCDAGEEMGRLTDGSPELLDYLGDRTSTPTDPPAELSVGQVVMAT